MRFSLTQRINGAVADVADAFSDPGYYAQPRRLPKLGQPEVLDRSVNGSIVIMRIRYRFEGDLSSAVKAAIDPSKLTWVDVSEHDTANNSVTFHLEPDHYGDRFSCRGGYRFVPDPEGTDATLRIAEGEVKVRMPLVGGAVERAIVSGLQEHLDAEAPAVEEWLTANGG